MNFPDEKYHGYDIYIRFEGLISGTTFYQTIFTVIKDNKGFYLLCRLSDLMPRISGYKQILTKEKVPGILKEVGLKKVRELIDLQQFEYEDEYIGEAEFDGVSWRCVITEIRQKH